MAEDSPKQPRERYPWERQPEEPGKQYKRFLVYRNMDRKIRSVRAAAEVNKLSKRGQFGAWQYWTQIAHTWHWFDRARAYDQHRDEMADRHARERMAELAIIEGDAQVASRQRQADEGREFVKHSARLSRRLQRLLEQPGAIEELRLKRSKAVIVRETVDEEGRPIVQRTELEQKSIMEFIPAMVALALDQPTEVVQNIGDAVEGILRAAFEVIRAELPPERWEAATQRILDACRDLDTPKSK
ncbi:MAG: hypothetical protein ABSD48_05960 [Armatimonadota bacterium]